MTLKELRGLFEGDYTLVALFDEESVYEEDLPLELYDGVEHNLTDRFNDCRVVGITTGLYPYGKPMADRVIIVHLDHVDVGYVIRDEEFYELYEIVYGDKYTRDKSYGEQNLDNEVAADIPTIEELVRRGYLKGKSPFAKQYHGDTYTLNTLFDFIKSRDTRESDWKIYLKVADIDDTRYSEARVEVIGIAYSSLVNLTLRDACAFGEVFHGFSCFHLSENSAYVFCD